MHELLTRAPGTFPSRFPWSFVITGSRKYELRPKARMESVALSTTEYDLSEVFRRVSVPRAVLAQNSDFARRTCFIRRLQAHAMRPYAQYGVSQGASCTREHLKNDEK